MRYTNPRLYFTLLLLLPLPPFSHIWDV